MKKLEFLVLVGTMGFAVNVQAANQLVITGYAHSSESVAVVSCTPPSAAFSAEVEKSAQAAADQNAANACAQMSLKSTRISEFTMTSICGTSGVWNSIVTLSKSATAEYDCVE